MQKATGRMSCRWASLSPAASLLHVSGLEACLKDGFCLLDADKACPSTATWRCLSMQLTCLGRCADPGLPGTLQEGRSERLCVLALPLGMSVADFCAFVGGYLPSVREMRLVRRSDESSVCLVLLRFKNRPTADLFYTDFNNRAVRLAHGRLQHRQYCLAQRQRRAALLHVGRWLCCVAVLLFGQ